MVASDIAELEAEVARLHNGQLQLEAELESAREDVRQAREAVHELLAGEDPDGNLLAVANATLRHVEKREYDLAGAWAAAAEQRKAAEVQLAEARDSAGRGPTPRPEKSMP